MQSSRRARLSIAILCVLAAWGVLAYRLLQRRPVDLQAFERSVFSPAGEDGVLEKIFEIVPPATHFLVDLGAGDGVSGSSSRHLIADKGWSGLLVENGEKTAAELAARYAQAKGIKTLRTLIDPGDIEIVLDRNGVPRDLDLLIIGLRSNDWYVWRAIRDFRPKVVQIQYNAAFVPPQTMVIEYHPLNYWDGSIYFGASIQSLYNLGQGKGYQLVYANQAGTNLFFVEAQYLKRFGVDDNSPWHLYRGCKALPQILPSQVWDYVKENGQPMAPSDGDLVVNNVHIPRTYVLGKL
jgi:hypothetical protein